jgi:hypothetical protein
VHHRVCIFHCYQVRFNTDPGYPLIVEIVDWLACDELMSNRVQVAPISQRS